jgi:hypothetical protein
MVFTVVALALLMMSIDGTIVATALHSALFVVALPLIARVPEHRGSC